MNYDEVKNELVNSPDFELFTKIISPRSPINASDVHPEGYFMNQQFFQETHSGESIKGKFHARLGSYSRIFWNDKLLNDLNKRFEELNEKSTEFNFEFLDASDYDEDPGERTYPARIYFKINKKII